MRRLLGVFETGFHLAMLALLMGAFLPLWREVSGSPVDPVEGDALARGLLLVGYGVVFLLLLLRPRALLRSFLVAWPLWVLILWAFLSLLWSTAPEVTFRKAGALLLSTLYGVYLALRFSPERLLGLLGAALLLLLGLSLALSLLLPAWGVMGYPHEGAWRGVFVHKNGLGRFTAFGVLVFLALLLVPGRRWPWYLGLLLSGLILWKARSATSLVLALAMVLMAWGLWLSSRYRGLWPVLLTFGFVLGGGLGMFVAANYQALLEALGRDVTFTGRVPLWMALIPFIQEQPWTGYGLGGFWLGWDGPSAYVWSLVNWDPPHGHNGYLDLSLDLGLVGLGLGLVLLLGLALGGVRGYLSVGFTPRTLFLVGLAVFLTMYNMAESAFLRSNNLFWSLLVWGYVGVKLNVYPVESLKALQVLSRVEF